MLGALATFLSEKINMMDGRVVTLSLANQGFAKFGVLLVGIASGLPTTVGTTDDLLTYAVIPWLAHFVHLDVAQATTLFYRGSLLIALLLALCGIWLYFKNVIASLIAAFVMIVLMRKTPLFNQEGIFFSDVYLASVIITTALLPLFFYYLKKGRLTFSCSIFLFLSGMMIGYGEYWRSFSTFPLALLFLGYLIVGQKSPVKNKLFMVIAFSLGILISNLHFHHIIDKRDRFLSVQSPNYHAENVPNKHPFWHPVYLGLGYYPNPYGIAWNDRIASDRVDSVKPGVVYLSEEYGQILRQSVFEFVHDHPVFFIKSTLKKVIECNRAVQPSIWVGFIFFFLFQKTWYTRFVLICAIACALLPGILVIPTVSYISGLASLLYLCASFGYGQCYELIFGRDKRSQTSNLLEKTT